MILDNINCPEEEDIDEDIATVEDHCRVLTFLWKIIETGVFGSHLFVFFYISDMNRYSTLCYVCFLLNVLLCCEGTSEELKCLLTFWTGRGVLSPNLEVEIIDIALPQSSTCFQTRKLS